MAPFPLDNTNAVVPEFTGSFEKFFTILLRSSINNYVDASEDDALSLKLWSVLCHRASLDVPTERVKPRYFDAKNHFNIRAALVLEESREQMSRGLLRNRQDRLARHLAIRDGAPLPVTILTLDVIVTEMKARGHGITFLTLKKDPVDNEKYFSLDQKEHLMPGQVMECSLVGSSGTESFVLGCVLPCHKKRIHKHAEFDMLLFEPFHKSTNMILTPVSSFIGPCRQFEACTGNPESLSFLQSLLGHQQYPTDEAPRNTNNKANNESLTEKPHFIMPNLNDSQEKAVSGFLVSPAKSISIVQGPPGTGKTSLLVALICRFLSLVPPTLTNEHQRRLVVCAPTNKAVSVLAKRFLAAATDEYGCSVRMLLVGDDEKLLESNKKSPLRPHYVYSWRKEILKELEVITKCYDSKNKDIHRYSRQEMLRKATTLRREIFRRLISLPPAIKNKVDEMCKGLADPKCGRESLFYLATQASNAIDTLEHAAVEFDLMKSADVIFCTLCSSASRVMRLTGESVEALIVDEAAAATEPDLYIPFHLRPTRLLIVGDPKQLPSTVLSDRAKGLGLDVSLQERLMIHCRYDFTMLNVQYRMHPEISSFPSRRFYNTQLRNGENVLVERGRLPLLLNGRPYTFLQVDGTETKGSAQSTCNVMEAIAVVDLVKELVRGSEQYRSSVRLLRIITFYTAQVFLIRKMLDNAGFKDVLVATVDSSQGCEADVVIVSLVRSASAGFLKDDRRMNVALTRARYQLVCVGNVARYSSMEAAHTLHHLAVDARDRSAIAEKEICINRPLKKIKNE